MGVEVLVIRKAADIDGVLVDRRIESFFDLFKYRLFNTSPPTRTLNDILPIDHNPVDIKFSGISGIINGVKENISFRFHSHRTPIPGVAEKIRDEVETVKDNQQIIWYAVSGRRATFRWTQMTVNQLRDMFIPRDNIYLTPVGTSGLDCKADIIRQLGITEFYEDDRRTILFLARLFPGVAFKFVDLGGCSFIEKDREQNTNIEVITFEKWRKAA